MSGQRQVGDASVSVSVPTEQQPEHGQMNLEDVLFPAIRWVAEDGAHVVESTEFDLRGLGEDWDGAFMAFSNAAFDLFDYLADLVSSEDATEHEQETAALLGTRCLAVVQARALRFETELREK